MRGETFFGVWNHPETTQGHQEYPFPHRLTHLGTFEPHLIGPARWPFIKGFTWGSPIRRVNIGLRAQIETKFGCQQRNLTTKGSLLTSIFPFFEFRFPNPHSITNVTHNSPNDQSRPKSRLSSPLCGRQGTKIEKGENTKLQQSIYLNSELVTSGFGKELSA